MLVFSLKNLTSAGSTYAAGQYVAVNAVDGAAMVAAGDAVACPFDPIAITSKINKAATAAAPASADFTFAFGGKTAGAPPVITGAQIAASVTTAPTGAGTPGIITVTGGPARSTGTIAITAQLDANAEVIYTANIAKGDTAEQVATKLKNAITMTDVAFVAAGAVVTGTPTPGTGNLTKFAIAVTGTTRR